jgi:hypothetical protein
LLQSTPDLAALLLFAITLLWMVASGQKEMLMRSKAGNPRKLGRGQVGLSLRITAKVRREYEQRQLAATA